MGQRVIRSLAVMICVISLCMYAILVVVFYIIPIINPAFQRFGYWQESVLIPTYAIVGLLITNRHPRHSIGWIFILASLAGAIQDTAGQYAIISLTTYKTQFPGGDWAAWISQLAQMITLSSFFFLFLLFPNGRLLSRRWKVVAWSLIAGISAQIIYRAFYNGQFEDFPISNPAGLSALAPFIKIINNIGGPLLTFGIFGSLAMLIVRTYHSKGIERQQIKWFAFIAVCVVCIIVAGIGLNNVLVSILPEVLIKPVMAVLGYVWVLGPVSLASVTALAILRYRLYEIDILIRRTLQYTLLTGILGLVYYGSVVVLQSLVEDISGEQSPAVIVISTLVIAALFNPLRNRIQAFIDRRFFRKKYDAEHALASFAATARDEVDVDNLTNALLGVVEETMQPEKSSLWLKK